ncbi:uncharacterized protein [Macrobrachium rosenbergii]|uniref:uncharacterized protein n=1 Tax=Macrobrachium rosenbergii TaxID=79674 RepID=UPI0034D697BC
MVEYVQSTQADALTYQNYGYRTLQNLHGSGKEAALTGHELAKWVKEQLDDLAKQEREERAEQWKEKEEQRKYEAEHRRFAKEQRQLEDAREERRRQNELALKKIPKWTEEEPEAWLEEIETLFDNYNTTETERALVLAKHMEGKAKAALHSLEKSQSRDMVEPTTLMEACRMADSWETYNQSHSTSQQHIVPPGYLSSLTRQRTDCLASLHEPTETQGKPYRCRACKVTGHSTSWEGCPNKQRTVDAPNQDSPRGSDLQLGQESLTQRNSSHLRGIAPPDLLSGIPDHQSLPVPLASSEQCHTPSVLGIEPTQELDPVPDPDHETYPPPGDPEPVTALILAYL